MARRQLPHKRILLTGASSGIGRELARHLAAYSTRLLLTARRTDRLEELAEDLRQRHPACEIVFQAGDITDPEHRCRLVDLAARHWGGLDLLINCAGGGAIGPFSAAGPDRLRALFELNFFAPVELARSCLPMLLQGHQPMLVNVGSVLGHRAVPWKSEYCASKFALHGWSDAVRAEWAAARVDVLHVSPSTTESEFFDRIEGDPSSAENSRRKGMSAQVVARKIVAAIESGKQEIILSAGGKLLVWFDRLAPGWANWLLSRYAARRWPGEKK